MILDDREHLTPPDNKAEKVYKPHEMRADYMILGQKGMFNNANRFIRQNFIRKCCELKSKLEKIQIHLQ